MGFHILVTHPDKGGQGNAVPNPGLSAEGEKQAEEIKQVLRDKIGFFCNIFCGTGVRHLRMAQILGIEPTLYSPLFGPPDSMDRELGLIVLPDGTKIPAKKYLSPSGLGATLMRQTEEDSLVICSRPLVSKILKYCKEGENLAVAGAVYAYDNDEQTINLLFSATEDAGAGKNET